MMDRFSEPQDFDPRVWRIFGTYKVEVVVFAKARAFDEIIDFDEVNDETYFLEFDIEMLKNSEPEIERVRFYAFSNEHRKLMPVVVTGTMELAAEDYLRDNHGRWNRMKTWLIEYGERERTKELAA